MKFDSRTTAISVTGMTLALVFGAAVRAATATATQYTGSEGAIGYNQTSASGAALEGTVSSSGQTSIKIPFGVLGEYEASSSTFGIGVAAVSTSGYGVASEALGSSPAMLGLASGSGGAMEIDSSGTGVAIQTYNGGGAIVSSGGSAAAVTATSTTGTTVLAESDNGDAGQFESLATYGGAPHGGIATIGLTNGIGVAAYGYAAYDKNPAVEATAQNAGDIFDGVEDEGNTTFALNGATANKSTFAPANGSDLAMEGDLFLHGAFYLCQQGQCTELLTSAAAASQDIATRDGTVKTYRAAQSQPTVEDTGEANLVHGSAYVALDADFAKTISSATPYLVFLTPEGDTRGIYIASRSRTGFTVSEHDGGHSNLAFSYRIVAQPSGAPVARFAATTPIRSPLYGRAKLPKPARITAAKSPRIAIPKLQ
jgi:hypothetical protein